MKILHFADIHADDKNYVEVAASLDHIIAGAIEKKPDLIVAAGDLSNSESILLDSKAAKLLFYKFRDLANIAPVVIVRGTKSHDGQAAEVLKFVKARHNIWYSDRAEQLYFYRSVHRDPFVVGSELEIEDIKPDAVISMIPAITKQYFETESDIMTGDTEIADAVSHIFTGFGANASRLGVPHIAVGHFQVGGAFIHKNQCLVGRDIEISTNQLMLLQAQVVCLGHIHMQQKLGENIFYSGSTTRLNQGEVEEKGYYIHDIYEDLGLGRRESHFIEIPTTKRITFRMDLTADQVFNDNDELTASFTDEQLQASKNAKVRVELKVYQDEVNKIDRKGIRQAIKDAGAEFVETTLVRIPRFNVRSQTILKLTHLPEKLEEMERLRDSAVSASVLKKAEKLETVRPDELIQEITASFADAEPESNEQPEAEQAAEVA